MPTREPRDVQQLSLDLRTVVYDLSRRLRSQSEHVTDIPLPQQMVLNRLRRNPGLTSAELSRAEHVRPQSMSTTVASLRREGLVEARENEEDARARRLFLTDEGARVLDGISSSRDDWLRQRLAEQLDDGQRKALTQAVSLLRGIAES